MDYDVHDSPAFADGVHDAGNGPSEPEITEEIVVQMAEAVAAYVNRPPVVVDDTAATVSGVPVTVEVLANDGDADGNLRPESVTVVAGPSHGSAVVDGKTGQVTYQSVASFSGTDTVTYTVRDEAGDLSAEATILFTVAPDLSIPAWRNPQNRFDVDGDGLVNAADALTIINRINAHPGSSQLPAPPEAPPPFYDVSGDHECSAVDVLLVINEINRRLVGSGGESEPFGMASRRDAAEPTRMASQTQLEDDTATFVDTNAEPVGWPLRWRQTAVAVSGRREMALVPASGTDDDAFDEILWNIAPDVSRAWSALDRLLPGCPR